MAGRKEAEKVTKETTLTACMMGRQLKELTASLTGVTQSPASLAEIAHEVISVGARLAMLAFDETTTTVSPRAKEAAMDMAKVRQIHVDMGDDTEDLLSRALRKARQEKRS